MTLVFCAPTLPDSAQGEETRFRHSTAVVRLSCFAAFALPPTSSIFPGAFKNPLGFMVSAILWW